MEKQELIIGWVITGGIAIIGWIIAIVQSHKNQKLQKTIEQKKMRHDAYSAFLRELDGISKDMSISPMNKIQEIAKKVIPQVLTLNYQAADHEIVLNNCLIEKNKNCKIGTHSNFSLAKFRRGLYNVSKTAA